MSNGVTADRRIDHVLTAIEGTHLGRDEMMKITYNLPTEDSDRFMDNEDLSREIFDHSHGRDNLENVNPEGQAIGVKCSECGEEWVTA